MLKGEDHERLKQVPVRKLDIVGENTNNKQEQEEILVGENTNMEEILNK